MLDKLETKKELSTKDYQEALNKAYEIISDLDFSSQLKCAEQFKVLQDAVDKANKYDEKETPKKPIKEIVHDEYDCDDRSCDFEYERSICPSCNEDLINEVEDRNYEGWDYCPNCGQRLDWDDCSNCDQKLDKDDNIC